jgi:O-methyltransferase involved in polyketide biosynthesis
VSLPGVSKTAILTLRARADEHARTKDRFFEDPHAVEWLSKLTWPRELDQWYAPRAQTFLAYRAHEIDCALRRHLEAHDRTVVVEVGCGLSSRFWRVPREHIARYVEFDLPAVIELRTKLGPDDPLHSLTVSSALDDAWIDALAGVDAASLFIIAEGLLYYLPRAEVDTLFWRLRKRFAGATIAFDVLGALDFAAARKRAKAAGTDIEWMIPAPFEASYRAFGVAPAAGAEPDVMMHRAIEACFPRFSALERLTVKVFSKVKLLAAQRSGTIVGRLLPLG